MIELDGIGVERCAECWTWLTDFERKHPPRAGGNLCVWCERARGERDDRRRAVQEARDKLG